MGFVIEPWCLFLFFKITDVAAAQAQLPDRYELMPTRVFAGDEGDYYYGMSFFNTRASTFHGSRLEAYLVARDRETGTTSWIFMDILSNTLIAHPKWGITGPNCTRPVCTTNPKGDILIDFKQDGTDRRIAFTGSLAGAPTRPLEQDLWIMGNSSIAHSRAYQSKTDEPFAVVFDPLEVESALEVEPAALLPKEYELLPTSLFDGDPTRPSAILSVFTARTSAFIGTRMELYLIARRKSDGSPAWIIVDYATNTNSYDPAKGFCGYDSDPAVFSMSPYGELLVDMAKRAEDGRPAERLSLHADISKGSMRALDRTLWVEGNLLVDYGGARHDTSSKAFSLIFDPYLMKEALELPPAAVEIADNSFLAGILDTESPPHCACFPYSQHFVIRQDLDAGVIKNEEDLERHIAAFLADRDFKTMKGSDLKKPILMGMLASGLFTWGLVIFLLIKVLA